MAEMSPSKQQLWDFESNITQTIATPLQTESVSQFRLSQESVTSKAITSQGVLCWNSGTTCDLEGSSRPGALGSC